MKTVLKLEELLMFGLGLFLAMQLPYPKWLFWALLLAPDIGMLGYVFGNRVGAFTYNILHHKGVAIGVFLIGIWFNWPMGQWIGALLFAHASIDRVFGYGLKYITGFKHTHLGTIGK